VTLGLLGIAHLGSRFVAAGAAVGAIVTIASGGLAWLHLVINAGRANFYEELGRHVDLGLAVGFGLGIPGAVIAFALNLH
jgi:hypothetical protein